MPNKPTEPVPEILQAPWRLAYLESISEKEKGGEPPKPGSGSFLLDYWRDPQHDVQNHVIERTDMGMILLNGFPYANGHLLVALGEPCGRLMDYLPTQQIMLWSLVARASDLMEKAIEPQGINFGINQGRAAGAGVPQHLHVHLVPRWSGDTNFISIVGQVRVNPSSLEAMYKRYMMVIDRESGLTT